MRSRRDGLGPSDGGVPCRRGVQGLQDAQVVGRGRQLRVVEQPAHSPQGRVRGVQAEQHQLLERPAGGGPVARRAAFDGRVRERRPGRERRPERAERAGDVGRIGGAGHAAPGRLERMGRARALAGKDAMGHLVEDGRPEQVAGLQVEVGRQPAHRRERLPTVAAGLAPRAICRLPATTGPRLDGLARDRHPHRAEDTLADGRGAVSPGGRAPRGAGGTSGATRRRRPSPTRQAAAPSGAPAAGTADTAARMRRPSAR